MPHVEDRRAFLRSKLGPFDDKAVLIMDGCSAHKIQGLEGFLAEKRIQVRFLVAHTSHLTQPLDLGIFGRCKTLMMSDQKYVINLHEVDEAIIDDIEAYNEGRPPSPSVESCWATSSYTSSRPSTRRRPPLPSSRPSRRPGSARGLTGRTPTWSITSPLSTGPELGR